MYEDIVDYDDFSERVGSENDILYNRHFENSTLK